MAGHKSTFKDVDPKYMSMPYVFLNITSDIKFYLTDKHIGSIMHVYDNYMNKFDWFIYANDDTFIAMDNLKLFLKDKCPFEPKLYGRVMKYDQERVKIYTSGNNSRGFLQGGCGILESHEAIRRFGDAMKKDPRF